MTGGREELVGELDAADGGAGPVVEGGLRHRQAFFTRMSALRAPGSGALDEQQVALGVGAHDAQLLDRRPVVAHVPGHPHALVDATGRGARPDRARLAMVVGAVGLGTALEVVALDVAGEALALGDAGDVDQLAGGEEARRRAAGRPRSRRRCRAGTRGSWRQLGQVLELAGLGLGELLRAPRCRAGRPCSRRARWSAGGSPCSARWRATLTGDHRPVVLEDLGHADLAADQSDAHRPDSLEHALSRLPRARRSRAPERAHARRA